MIGNALEWYDFALYGYFATMIGKLIFPPDQDPISLLLKSYAVFFLGFIMRPIGALVFGYIGDRYGRKKALVWSIYCMAIPTTLIGCLPTFQQVGPWSAVILVILRLFQGLSMGGEFTGSMIFVVEHAPDGKKGFWGSWSAFSVIVGLLIGSVFGMIISTVLSVDQLEQWGWRIPFLLSFGGSWVAISLRKSHDEAAHVPRSSVQNAHNDQARSGLLKRLFSEYWRDMVRVVFIDVVVAVGFFLISIYIMTYLQNFCGASYRFASLSSTISMVTFASTIPISGWFSDRCGMIAWMQGAVVALGVLAVPCFFFLSSANPWMVVATHGLLAAVMGCVFAVVPALMVSVFPPDVRYSGVSIAHNISMAIFGGSAPQVATYLIRYTKNTWLSGTSILMPGVFLAIAALVSWLGLSNLKKSRN
jgi:MHS family proline/betaine transporter-like MFS transporter